MNGVIEGGSKVMLHRSGFGQREGMRVGDYQTGFIVIAVLLKKYWDCLPTFEDHI